MQPVEQIMEYDSQDTTMIELLSRQMDSILEEVIQYIWIPNKPWPLKYGIEIVTAEGEWTGLYNYVLISEQDFRTLQAAEKYYDS